MLPSREMMRLKYSTDYGRAPRHLWYCPVHPAPGRKAHGTMSEYTGGQHSPPRVKLFANGMSKWTGAIFGILDVLLSMPKNWDSASVRNRKAYRDHATGG